MADFEMPVAQGRNHPLLVEENDGHGLYLTINMPGKEAAPHDHGIWCGNMEATGSVGPLAQLIQNFRFTVLRSAGVD